MFGPFITGGTGGTSGMNTGDVTLGAFGSSPATAGASLSGQILTLQPADATHAGGLSTTTQTIAGNKTFSGDTIISGTLNMLNASSTLITRGTIQLYGATQGTEGNSIDIKAPADPAEHYIITLPSFGPSENEVFTYFNGDYDWRAQTMSMNERVFNASNNLVLFTADDGDGNQILQQDAGFVYEPVTNVLTVTGGTRFTSSTEGGTDYSFTLNNYRTSTEQNLGTVTWTGVAAPSGTVEKTYVVTRIGQMITIQFRIEYSVAGTANTGLSFPLPSDCPEPFAFGANTGEIREVGSACILADPNTPTVAGIGMCYFLNPAAVNTIQVICAASVAAKFCAGSITYRCGNGI